MQAPEETEGTDDDDDGLAVIEGQICQEETKEQSVKDQSVASDGVDKGTEKRMSAPDKEIFELSERMGDDKDAGDLIEIGSRRLQDAHH